MKKIYLIIENASPTIHKDLNDAECYLTFVRDTSKQHKNLKAMYCTYTAKNVKDGFSTCTFTAL